MDDLGSFGGDISANGPDNGFGGGVSNGIGNGGSGGGSGGGGPDSGGGSGPAGTNNFEIGAGAAGVAIGIATTLEGNPVSGSMAIATGFATMVHGAGGLDAVSQGNIAAGVFDANNIGIWGTSTVTVDVAPVGPGVFDVQLLASTDTYSEWVNAGGQALTGIYVIPNWAAGNMGGGNT
jgi:hypothetical protein